MPASRTCCGRMNASIVERRRARATDPTAARAARPPYRSRSAPLPPAAAVPPTTRATDRTRSSTTTASALALRHDRLGAEREARARRPGCSSGRASPRVRARRRDRPRSGPRRRSPRSASARRGSARPARSRASIDRHARAARDAPRRRRCPPRGRGANSTSASAAGCLPPQDAPRDRERLGEVRVHGRVELAQRHRRREPDRQRAALERRGADRAGERAPAQRAVREAEIPPAVRDGDPDLRKRERDRGDLRPPRGPIRASRASRSRTRRRSPSGSAPCTRARGDERGRRLHRVEIAGERQRRRAGAACKRSSAGTCSSADGPLPSGLARSVPVAAGT